MNYCESLKLVICSLFISADLGWEPSPLSGSEVSLRGSKQSWLSQ